MVIRFQRARVLRPSQEKTGRDYDCREYQYFFHLASCHRLDASSLHKVSIPVVEAQIFRSIYRKPSFISYTIMEYFPMACGGILQD